MKLANLISTATTFSLVLLAGAFVARPALAAEHADHSKVVAALPSAKVSMSAGLQQATAKAPEAAISAKYEMDDAGKLSLSVYTVEKGTGVDAEHNVLKELSGSPEGGAWTTKAEVFKDVEHVSRASEQLTLMALCPHTLLDVVKKAEKDAAGGTVFSIAPKVKEHKPAFVVLVANNGKVSEVTYDLMTGEKK